MHPRIGSVGTAARVAMVGVSLAALGVAAHGVEYKMTVNGTGSSTPPTSRRTG